MRSKMKASLLITTLVSAALASLSSPALAGTYSVVGLEWYPANSPGVGTNGGYIHFDTNNPLDLDYGLFASVSVPTRTADSLSANPTVSGTFRWRVRWTGAVGEAHPQSVSAVVRFNGSGNCHAAALNTGGTGQGRSDLSDKYYTTGALANSGAVGQSVVDDHTASGPHNDIQGAANFTQVFRGRNTWDGYVLMSVGSQAKISASGSKQSSESGSFVALGNGGATARLDVVLRLTYIAGQRVQPDN